MGTGVTSMLLSLDKNDQYFVLVIKQTGNVLLSQAVARQVSSALWSLTSVFGMGTGVTSMLLSPDYP